MTSLIRLRTAGMDSAVISFRVNWFLDECSSLRLRSVSGLPSSNFNVARQLIYIILAGVVKQTRQSHVYWKDHNTPKALTQPRLNTVSFKLQVDLPSESIDRVSEVKAFNPFR